MKRLLFLMGIILLITGPAVFSAEPGQAPDFRNVRWGMSLSEVKKTEKLEVTFEDHKTLCYETTLAGLACHLGYSFNHNRLYQAGYIFTHEHANNTDFIDDYDKVKDLLKQKYGEPKQDDVIWKDDLYQDDPSQWGMAIVTGGLVLRAVWENDRTIIILNLSGDNYETSFGIGYYNKEGQEERDKEEQEKELENV